MAQRLGVAKGTISKDRKWLLAQWIQMVLGDVTEIVAQQLAQLDEMDRELWAAWHRSKKAKGRSVKKETPDGTVREKHIEGRLPAVRYMEAIRRNMEIRIKLLGLDQEHNQKAAIGILEAMIEAAKASQDRHDRYLEDGLTVDDELDEYQ